MNVLDVRGRRLARRVPQRDAQLGALIQEGSYLLVNRDQQLLVQAAGERQRRLVLAAGLDVDATLAQGEKRLREVVGLDVFLPAVVPVARVPECGQRHRPL